MHANNYSTRPTYSNTPILQSAAPQKLHSRRTYTSSSKSAPKTESHRSATQSQEIEAWIRQIFASGAALPAAAGFLLLANHLGWVWRLLQGVGIIDCIAISCLVISAVLAAPQLIVMLNRGWRTTSTAVSRLPEMADNIVTLSSTVDLVQRDPAPKHWLDMYYNMVSDIDNLLQEMIQLRKLMSDMHSDVEHVKDKTAWMRFQKSHKDKRNDHD